MSGRKPRELGAENRGLASGILMFAAMIVISALLFTMMQPAASDVFAMSSSRASAQKVNDAIDMRESIFSSILFFALFLSGVAFIARAVLESRRGA